MRDSGWTVRETIEYRGLVMTVMQIDLRSNHSGQPSV